MDGELVAVVSFERYLVVWYRVRLLYGTRHCRCTTSLWITGIYGGIVVCCMVLYCVCHLIPVSWLGVGVVVVTLLGLLGRGQELTGREEDEEGVFSPDEDALDDP